METAFAELAGPYRRELLAHCYRMLGSVDDAEDLVQETYLRAWRSYDGVRGPVLAADLALPDRHQRLPDRDRAARPAPAAAGLGAPSRPPERPLVVRGAAGCNRSRTCWPRRRAAGGRGSLRLALVAALQHLPARQRAVLILRDVLGWPAAESPTCWAPTPRVNSALQRARARLATLGLVEDEQPEPTPDDLLDRYVAAFDAADVPALTSLLRADATLEMPPYPTWFAGRDDVVAFLSARLLAEPHRGIRTTANGQPAVALYVHGRPHGLQVLDVRGGRIAGIVVFLDPDLFPRFGLPGPSGLIRVSTA